MSSPSIAEARERNMKSRTVVFPHEYDTMLFVLGKDDNAVDKEEK